MQSVVILLTAGVMMFSVIGGLSLLAHYYTLNGIKSRTVGDGQHGTARFATKKEIEATYEEVLYEPEKWRRGENLPTAQGIILGSIEKAGKLYALYQYGISNGLVILLNVFTALMIGLLSGHLVTAIVFTLFFMMLRSYSGGYHSDSRLFCYVTSSAVLLIPVYTSQLMRNIPPMAVISILCLASCIIWQLSPMDSPKRKLDAEERKHFGNRARKILLAELAVFALLYGLRQYKLAYAGFCSFCLIAFCMLIGTAKLKIQLHMEK